MRVQRPEPIGEDGFQPGRWFHVLAPDGSVWLETSDQKEARRGMRPGDRLERLYRRTEDEWRPVPDQVICQESSRLDPCAPSCTPERCTVAERNHVSRETACPSCGAMAGARFAIHAADCDQWQKMKGK